MAQRHTINTTKTAAAAGILAGTFDPTGIYPLLVGIDVTDLHPAASECRITVEDTAIGDFTDALPVALFVIRGSVTDSDVAESRVVRELPAIRGKLRVNLQSITGTSPSVTFTAFADGQ